MRNDAHSAQGTLAPETQGGSPRPRPQSTPAHHTNPGSAAPEGLLRFRQTEEQRGNQIHLQGVPRGQPGRGLGTEGARTEFLGLARNQPLTPHTCCVTELQVGPREHPESSCVAVLGGRRGPAGQGLHYPSRQGLLAGSRSGAFTCLPTLLSSHLR